MGDEHEDITIGIFSLRRERCGLSPLYRGP